MQLQVFASGFRYHIYVYKLHGRLVEDPRSQKPEHPKEKGKGE